MESQNTYIKEEGAAFSSSPSADSASYNGKHSGGAHPPANVARAENQADDISTTPSRPQVVPQHLAVPIGYFNPSAPQPYSRANSSMSAQEAHIPNGRNTGQSSSLADSEARLIFGDGPFDFEKSFRQFLKRCVNTYFLLRD